MKKILTSLDRLQAALEQEIQKREDRFENRSEKWQDSERGQDFLEKTDHLTEMLDTVTDWQNDLIE